MKVGELLDQLSGYNRDADLQFLVREDFKDGSDAPLVDLIIMSIYSENESEDDDLIVIDMSKPY